MKEMVNLSLRTAFSFKSKVTYGTIPETIKMDNGTGIVGVADMSGTYGLLKFEKLAKAAGIKPIYGIRLMVVNDSDRKSRKAYGPVYTFIAKNEEGYREINELARIAYVRFYYKAFICLSDVFKTSNNVFVIAENFVTPERIDYIALTTTTPRMMLDWDIPKVAMQNNFYLRAEDKQKYEVLCGARKHGADGVRFLFDNQTYPMHILTTAEWYRIWKDEEAIENTHVIASECNVEIPIAPMVKFPEERNIRQLCVDGAKRLKIDWTQEYQDRLDRELSIIEEKEYTDYFLVVADMVVYAKKLMFVGPSRGSCAGSLVCYLMDITTIDPILHGLVFERFIDVNRHDLPDIDIDFPDHKRVEVIKYLIRKYGEENVSHIANFNKLRPKSAIGETAMALSIPWGETEQVKNSIVKLTGGDARANLATQDTLKTTEVGKAYIERYPNMKIAFELELHPTHAGKHAGGIIVCNDDITKYCGMNPREDCAMMDKADAEARNLLKIDVLGLRTLTILEEAAGLAGFDFRDFYEMPLDLEYVFEVLNEQRFSGIFQFEGQAMMMLCKEMGVYKFDDIVAITALARPGPLHSGGANTFIKRRIGAEPTVYISDNPLYVSSVENTYGVIVYQEQLMTICRNLGSMTWEEVCDIRRGSSKTLGRDFFENMRESFVTGAVGNGVTESEATEIWENMITFGSWGMNKSHTVAYGLISYWCAFMKAKFPLEFAAATLNHQKNTDSALRMLRDMVENDGIEYIDVDPDESDVRWTIKDGKLVGGLINIDGIAEKGAKQIIAARRTGKPLTPSQYQKLIAGVTAFSVLYPVRHWWGDYFERPWIYGITPPSKICDLEDAGEYIIMGKMKHKDLRDLNEYNEVMKRGGKVLSENDKFLRLTMEDDTGQINAKIDRFKFDRLDGAVWAEILKEDKSWLILRGRIRPGGWRIFEIDAIADLEEIEYHGENNFVLEREQRGTKVLGDRVGL